MGDESNDRDFFMHIGRKATCYVGMCIDLYIFQID